MTLLSPATAHAGEIRQGARNGVAGVAGAAVSAALGFVLTVVIVHGLGAAGSGDLFTAIGVVTVVAAACCAGADTGLLRVLPSRRDHPGGRPAAVLVVALTPSLALATVVALIGATRHGSPAVRLAFLAVPIVVAATVLLAAVRAARPIGAYLGLQSVFVPAVRPLLVAGLVAAGAGTAATFAAWLLPVGVAAVAALALLVTPLGLRHGLRPTGIEWRTFWAFALPRGLSAAIDAGGMWVGVIMTSVLAGSVQAGIFAAVGRYALAGLLVMQGLRLAVAPQLSRLLGSGRTAAAAAVYRGTSATIIMLSWPMYVLLAVFAPGFLHLFGEEFAAGATAMTLLCGAMLVNSGVGIVQTMLLMSGHSGRHLAATATGLVLSLALGVVLIPRFGALGAAVAWSLAIVVENLLAAWAARRVIGEPLADPFLRRVAAGAIGAGLLVATPAVPLGRGVAGLAAAGALLALTAALAMLHPRLRSAARALYPRSAPKEASRAAA